MTAASLASLVPLPVAIPLAGAAVAPLAARLYRPALTVVSVLALLASAAVLVVIAPTVYGGHVLVEYLGKWGPVNGQVLGVTFGVDAWGLTFALVAASIGAVLLIFMVSDQATLGRREAGASACLFLLLDAALIGGALTADLFNLFVWFEVAALASYALTAFFLERPPALEAAFKVLVLTNVASFLIFIATALLYTRHGALNLGQLHDALVGHTDSADLIALGLLIAGFATKAGLVPFHGWLPDAHTVAPGPISALFSGLMVNFGIATIGRIVFSLYPGTGAQVLGLLMVLGLVSAVGGAIFALLQDDLKRLLAYDTISQMGVLAIGLATASPTGLAGTAYHLVNHALFKSLLFLCAGAIVHATGATNLSNMHGLARRMPWLVGAFTVGAAAIAGIPPLNGYVSLGLIHQALERGHQTVPYVLTLLAQAITVAALGKAVLAFFRRQRNPYARDERLRPGMRAALLLIAGACLTLGVAPEWVLNNLIEPASAALSDAPAYTHAVLSGGGQVDPHRISYHYLNPLELALLPATVVLAAPLIWLARRYRDSQAIRRVRSVQTGSVNDYASYLVVGLLVTVASTALVPLVR
ncbi:proton-conducting transporter membrane subunit [Rugosimonospora acidiphila]|uniref:Proton-conducting transporter membrane subunit n=1 Tax=Rugosimonospora acidiphila TaxID=556531 RepID=A0ABP9SGE8_9ACTN